MDINNFTTMTSCNLSECNLNTLEYFLEEGTSLLANMRELDSEVIDRIDKINAEINIRK